MLPVVKEGMPRDLYAKSPLEIGNSDLLTICLNRASEVVALFRLAVCQFHVDFPVALKRAISAELSCFAIFDAAANRLRSHDGHVEVDQVGMFGPAQLRHADAVWIMAGRTWRPGVDDVSAVQ